MPVVLSTVGALEIKTPEFNLMRLLHKAHVPTGSPYVHKANDFS
jgi:hypothetical protein